ncbi:hypothetical protein PINS_up001916 [Pythium insidiosum]|nr:hypothetical protein PINS_up001916 [Pythium insidiosum]
MAASANRNAVVHLACMLAFHVASALFGALLVVLLGLTSSGVLLVLLCVISGSTRTTRVLVASLWRTELRINKLYEGSHADRQGYERLPSPTRGSTPSPPPRPTSYHGREVTVSVMIFSILYFILFRGFFNLVFSGIPLALWYVTLCQMVPSIAPDPDFVIGADVLNRLVVGIAFAFATYQVSDTAARFSTYVSDKSGSLIFPEGPTASSRARDANARTPLLPTDSFSSATYAEYQSMQRDQMAMRAFMEPPQPPQPSAPAPPAAPRAPTAPIPPPPPPIPPFGTSESARHPHPYFPPGFEPRSRRLDDAYESDAMHHELRLCCLKMVVNQPEQLESRSFRRPKCSWTRKSWWMGPRWWPRKLPTADVRRT